MNSFGALNGVTASSLLLLEEEANGFLKACNKSIDQINLHSMSNELAYMQSIGGHIRSILKTKPEFHITDGEDKKTILNNILSSLCLVISNRTGISANFGTTDLFGENSFDDLFDESDDSDDSSDDLDLFGEDDLFGDEEFSEDVSIKETMSDSISVDKLVQFSKSPEYIQNSLEISDIDVNNLLDELLLIKDKKSVFEARCKSDPDSPINQSKGIQKIISSGRGNAEVIDFIEKSFNRLSLFHLSFTEMKELLSDIESHELLSDSEDNEVDLSVYSEKSVIMGDYLAYFIYTNMYKKSYSSDDYDLVSRLIAFCDAKASKNSTKSTVLGIPLNLCHLKFRGSNYKSFCESLESAINNIPNSSLANYYSMVKNILSSLKIINRYISTVTFNQHSESEFFEFKAYVKDCILKGTLDNSYNVTAKQFVEILKQKKLFCSKKQLTKFSDDFEEALEMYVSEVYDTYRLFNLSTKFSTDYYNSLLPQEVIDSYGVMDIDTLIEIDKYLKDVYKIIPLTLSNFVMSKVLATSKTNKVVDREVYGEVKPHLSLLIENYESKYFVKERESHSGILEIR